MVESEGQETLEEDEAPNPMKTTTLRQSVRTKRVIRMKSSKKMS